MNFKYIPAFFAFILFVSGQAFGREELNLLDQKYKWLSPSANVKLEVSGAGLTISSTSEPIAFYNKLPFDAKDKDFDILLVEMKTSRSGIGSYWAIEPGKRFDPRHKSKFYIGKPGKFHTYYINLMPLGSRKKIAFLVFHPSPGRGTAELKTFKLIKGSFWEKILAGWQEFWGPKGREPTGKNFLIFESPYLFGKPIFFFINIIIIGVLLLSVIIKEPKLTIFTILFLWVLLEFSSLKNNWILFKWDRHFYWGKDMEQKRTAQNEKDFYAFMRFAEKNIPNYARIGLIAPPLYSHSQAKLAYYLYPKIDNVKKAEYILVIDAKPDAEIKKRFKIWKEFRPGAYIMKSKIPVFW